VNAANTEGEPAVDSYLEIRLSAFLDSVAARTPAPGGGAAAAITAGLAASLVVMAARYSAGTLADSHQLVDTGERLRRRAGALADADAEAYGAVISAQERLRNGGSTSRDEVRRALRRAAAVPLEVAEVGAETARLAAVLAVEAKPDVRGDAVTALVLAEAATRSAAHLAVLNTHAGGGDVDLAQRAADCVAVARGAAADSSVHPES
jgi:formiminotetrahydrofolate cyclodeaminase